MLAKTALLIVSNPHQIGKILPSVQKRVKNTLYIHLLSTLRDPFSFHPNIFNTWPKYSPLISGIYTQTAQSNLDVRVLLSGLKYKNLSQIRTKDLVELVIFDKKHPENEIDEFISKRIQNVAQKCDILTLDSGSFVNLEPGNDGKVYKHTVLGGTFDRLHTAHKLLLSEAVLRAEQTVTVGVTDESMIKGKILWELIQDINVRIHSVKNFLQDICPELNYDVVPISDPFGPSIVDPTMEMIVVSAETLKGGHKINEIRVNERNLPKLDVYHVTLIEEPHPNSNEEAKISSSTTRMRLLGTLLKPVEKKTIPNKPYVIGLTGGVASGKSGVTDWLKELGVQIINCDLLGHQVYKPGKPCHAHIVRAFGEKVLTSEGEINRKVLGSIVFANPDDLKKLNELVWPCIIDEVKKIIEESESRVVVVEAAVLLQANWDKYCHEVWCTLAPRAEAIKRLMERNHLTESQAIERIESQPSNKTYVEASNVVFCPLWEKEYTREQVHKAWDLLQHRLLE